MNNFVNFNNLKKENLETIFERACMLENNPNKLFNNKIFALFFPESSIRTRASYESAIGKFGGTIISFPSSALDKKEEIQDVIGYLNNWVDVIIIRHNNYNLVKEISSISKVPVINAMTDANHPCEIISDIFSISKLRKNYLDLTYLFIGPKSNIGNSWLDIANKLKLKLIQACPKGYELKGSEYLCISNDLDNVIGSADVIITDSIIHEQDYLERFQITQSRINKMKDDALFNPTPPFYRGEVVDKSFDVTKVKQFVGYKFKKNLFNIQTAIILWCLND